jgi:hypothetical protein
MEGAISAGASAIGYEVALESALKYIPDKVKHLIRKVDVAKPVKPIAVDCDCVLSIEVAEHVMPNEADQYVKNLTAQSNKLIVMSSSTRKGFYHFNPQPRKYWINKIEQNGFTYSEDLTNKLREAWKSFAQGYLLYDLMVFERRKK